MDLPIVVGVDGSEPSLRAVDWAADEADLRGMPLYVVYACLWERYEGAALARELGRPTAQVLPQEITGAAVRRALERHPDLRVTSDVVFEEPEFALVRESRNASTLVVGNRGRSGLAEALLGSVGLTAAAHAHCPVVVVRGSHDKQATPSVHGRIVVGVGDSAEDSATVRFAFEEARRRGVPLEAVRAWRCPAHETTDHPLLADAPARLHQQNAEETLAKALRDAPRGLELERRTVEGHARRVLVGASYSADLLIVGAKRRTSPLGLQLGRVAHTALHHSACPVAVVPQPA
ncbi:MULTISPECIES: universal stress protein [unclassified Streptomyces]|uniref:universal stress protein n=1 Tax=unclassified Streptomyces TaxID=2593676 RepID=UPI0008992F2B|nr:MULTISPECIES: universal stress protein [unclassified Streptomyces]SEE06668.1 Nucleotide-binding universal stress protein, UspA family [Streptomyces sp. PAN_FS17]SEE71886.1 Nucleotide-binding universal stress protein, UspA family [Streptomyces sp. KS_5]